jgi:hypothetical protein
MRLTRMMNCHGCEAVRAAVTSDEIARRSGRRGPYRKQAPAGLFIARGARSARYINDRRLYRGAADRNSRGNLRQENTG